MLENGSKECTCPKTKCKRYGNCIECISHHKKSLPRCKRKSKKNKKLKCGIIIVIICVAAIGSIFLINPIRSSIALKFMKPLETQEIIADIYAIKNQFVNVYLVKSGDTYIAFDAGLDNETTKTALDNFGIDVDNISVVFLTHTDYDHVNALSLFSSAKIYMSESNENFLENKKGQSRSEVFLKMNREYNTLKDGESVTIANTQIQCIYTPGHTDGSVSYVVDGKYLFTGDNLNLKNGKVVLYNAVFNMDGAEQKNSIRKLAGIKGIEYVFTMHTGYTADFNTAFSDWIE